MIDLAVKVISNDNSIGDYTFYTSLILQIKLSVYTIVNELFIIRSNKLKIENIFDFFEIENKVINNGKLKLKKIKSIEFVNASFRYPCTKQNAVSNINLQINYMDKICIVGLNGAGKSTLIKLLLRFYDVDSGEILINGKNIKKYDIKSLRYCFGCYFQNSINYGFTLFDNNGIELSGGQHQKLALARTVYRNSQVLILDEPSSNLDPKAENSFFVSLENMAKSKTVIFTSHRLSNIDLAKKIVIMKDGCIIDIGTKNELLNSSTLFSEMYNIQADKYKSKA